MTFTRDWSHTRVHWPDLFADFEPRQILEIGCFEGQATRWMLDRWPEAHVVVVDLFEIDEGQYTRFLENVPEAGWAAALRCLIQVGLSESILGSICCPKRFDLIYVDGDHSAPGVLSDAVRAFPLLRPGGWMLFDDYNFAEMPSVYLGVEAFVSCFDALLIDEHPVGADQYLVVKA